MDALDRAMTSGPTYVERSSRARRRRVDATRSRSRTTIDDRLCPSRDSRARDDVEDDDARGDDDDDATARVDVVSRARNRAVVCWHKGLEVCGRGDVEAKGSCCETDACRSPEEAVYCVQEGAAATDGQLLVRPLYKQCLGREWVEGSSGRGGTRVQACWTSTRTRKGRRASVVRH